MNLDSSLISYAVRSPLGMSQLQRAGLDETFFTDDYARVWKWISKTKRTHGKVPSSKVVATRYPHVDIHSVKDRDVPILMEEIRKRKTYMDFMGLIEEASRQCDGPDSVLEVMTEVQGAINQMSVRNGQSSMVDLFSPEVQKRMLRDQMKRRKGNIMGMPTGLKKFDSVTGGLQKGRLVVIIGRPGLGKSWLDLLFVASTVMYGGKVGLYPLEMTLEETAMRLYTIFSCRMFSPSKALRNLDLHNGRLSKQKVARLLGLLEDKYAGQLYVADIGRMSDPYTVERVEAEQQIYRFDMQWIDYLTLMKAPGVGRDGGEDHTTVKALSNGCKQIAVRQKSIMGVSAQVSRSAISGKALLPRLEHIAYGDSIGQDADHVISINRKGDDLFYGVVKNRHGPELGKIRVRFAVDKGDIEETTGVDEADEDDD